MVEVWGEDEGRLGLKPITRRTWGEKGSRPIALQCRKYQWLHAYCFVHPVSGRSFWLLMPFVNTDVMTIALKQFAKYANPRKKKMIVLLVDQAGWHTTDKLTLPEGIVLMPLPAHTPELQPVECLWPLLWESVANRPFTDLDEIEEKAIARCQYLMRTKKLVQGRAGFGWIMRAEERKRLG